MVRRSMGSPPRSSMTPGSRQAGSRPPLLHRRRQRASGSQSQKGVLPPGTYHATVQVSSTTPGVAPVSIRVTLEVRPLQSSDPHAQPGHRGSRRRGQRTPHRDGYRLRAHQWGTGRRLRGIVCSRDGGACDGAAGVGPGVLLHRWLPVPRAVQPHGLRCHHVGAEPELRGRVRRTSEQDPGQHRLGGPAEHGRGVRRGAARPALPTWLEAALP